MSTVSTSFDIVYGTRKTIATSGLVIRFGVRKFVSQSVSLVHAVREFIVPGKVFSIEYGIRKTVSKNFIIRYGVLVPIIVPGNGGAFSTAYSSAYDSGVSSGGGGGGKAVAILYGTRARVSKSVVVQYDTAAIGVTTVSKSFSIVYHTLKKSTANEIFATPIEVDKVPPQLVTTTSW